MTTEIHPGFLFTTFELLIITGLCRKFGFCFDIEDGLETDVILVKPETAQTSNGSLPHDAKSGVTQLTNKLLFSENSFVVLVLLFQYISNTNTRYYGTSRGLFGIQIYNTTLYRNVV